jgi:hypothetical protein
VWNRKPKSEGERHRIGKAEKELSTGNGDEEINELHGERRLFKVLRSQRTHLIGQAAKGPAQETATMK